MIFNKTNRSTGATTTSGASSKGNSSSNTTFVTSSDIQRYIWGQWDNGEDDINGNAYINGNVFVSSQGETEYNEDDDGDDEENRNPAEGAEDTDDEETRPDFNAGNLDEIFDTDTGNLYVEKKLRVDGDIESPNIYGKSLFLDYKNAKTNVLDLFKDYEDRITKCENDITNLYSRVVTIEGDVTNIKGDITTINGSITDIYNKINNLGDNITNVEGSAITEARVKEIVNEMLPSKYGSQTQPIVLISGILRKDPNYFSTNQSYIFSGHHSDCIKDLTYVSHKVKNGVLYFNYNVATGFAVYVDSVIVMQRSSGEVKDDAEGDKGGRNDGAHWFQASLPIYLTTNSAYDRTILIREFHQSNGDNDSWASNDWGEKYNESVDSVQITVCGYAVKL